MPADDSCDHCANALLAQTSGLSIVGTLVMMVAYLCYPRLHNFTYALVFWMALAECLYSASNMLGTPAAGSVLCYVQAYTQSYFMLAAVFWNLLVSYVLKNAVLRPGKIFGISGRMRLFHAYAWGIPAVLVALPMATESYGDATGWCWIKDDLAGEFWRFFQFYFPLWAVMGYSINVYISMRGALATAKTNAYFKNTLAYFPLILVFCWLPASVNRLQNVADQGRPLFWLYVMQVAFSNMLGFVHFVAYGCTRPVWEALRGKVEARLSHADSLSTEHAYLNERGADAKSWSRTPSRLGPEDLKVATPANAFQQGNEYRTPSRPASRKASMGSVSTAIKGAYLYNLGVYQLMGAAAMDEDSQQDLYRTLSNRYSRPLAGFAETPAPESSAASTVPEKPERTSTQGAYLTLMKSFVGLGILAIPGAYAKAGYILATGSIVLIAVVSYYCAYLLVMTKNMLVQARASRRASSVSRRASNASMGGARAEVGAAEVASSGLDSVDLGSRGTTRGRMSFPEVGEAILGARGRLVVELSIAISQACFVCAYFLFIGENVAAVANLSGLFQETWPWVMVATVGITPLLYIRQIKYLVLPAIFADIIIVFGLGVIFYYDAERMNRVHESVRAFNFGGLPLFFGIAVFAFEGINTVLPVEQSMEEPERFPGVLRRVILHLTVIMVLVGALSYSAFGSSTADSILFSLPANTLVKCVQVLYSAALFFSVPIQMYPAYQILESYSCFKSVFGSNHYLFRFVVIVAVGGVACAVPKFGLFLNIVGAVGGSLTAFILPSIFYMLQTNSFTFASGWRPGSAIVFGVVGGSIAFTFSVIAFISS